MNRFRKSIIFFLFAFLITVWEVTGIQAGTVFSEEKTEAYLDEISKYQLSANSNPVYGSIGGEWTVMGLARYGTINETYKQKYMANLKASLDSCDGVLSTRKYTEYARVIIALTSIGENPENFYGYNLVQPLAEYDKITFQGLNGIIYALIALDSGNYKVPSLPEGSSSQKTTRDKLVKALLNAQLSDGGWSLSGKTADSDMTAMAIQALIPYKDNNSQVKQAINEGFDVLGKLQKNSGGFDTAGNDTCESTAQVLTAMSEAGVSIEDKRFVKNGNTVLDGLMSYYKDGAFSHMKGEKTNAMSTDQSMYALVSYYRNISGKNRLFDMSDGLVYRTTDGNSDNKNDGSQNGSGDVKEHVTKREESSLPKNNGVNGNDNKSSENIGQKKDENNLSEKPDNIDKEIKSGDNNESKNTMERENHFNDSVTISEDDRDNIEMRNEIEISDETVDTGTKETFVNGTKNKWMYIIPLCVFAIAVLVMAIVNKKKIFAFIRSRNEK